MFEKLGLSLYDFLRVNQYRPFRVDVVRDFGRQLLESVAYLHGLELIHTDLKPENILLATCLDDRKSPTPGIRCACPTLLLCVWMQILAEVPTLFGMPCYLQSVVLR